ncbi:MAG: GAF domain-containing protein [Anaerolineales bacterium]
MKNTFFSLPETMNPKVRDAVQIGMAIAGAHFIALPYYLYLILSLGIVRLTMLTIVTLILAIVISIGTAVMWRGRTTTGMIVVLLSLIFFYPPIATFLASGLGTVLGVALIFVGPMSAFQVLPRKLAWTMTVGTIISGATTLLLDMFSPVTRPPLPGIYIQLLATAVVIVLAVLVFRQFRNYPMGTKLVVSFVAVAIFAITAVSLITYQITSAQITERVGENLAASADGMALEITSNLDDGINTLQTLSLTKFLQETSQNSSAAGTSNVSTLISVDKQWAAADDSSPLVKRVLNNGLSEELSKFQKQFPEYVEVFVTDKYGAIIASTNRTSDYYQADEEWWQSAWNNGRGNIYVSQPEFDQSSNTMSINLAMPINAANSTELVGVLRATLDVSSLLQVVDNVDVGETGHADLIFRDQTYKAGEMGLTPVDPKEMNGAKPFLGSYGKTNFEGVPSLLTLIPVNAHTLKHKNIVDQLGWFVLIHQTIDEATQPVTITTRTILLSAFVLVLLAALAALGMAQFLSGPIVRLTAVAEQIAAGEINAQAEAEFGDETGSLAKAFNTMTDRLREILSGLEQRVAARTRNLELAAEVGRAVSQVRDLDVMLKEACELILKEFNLYYVQVYLTDANGSRLKLEAGTGTVGAQLVERGHNLPLDTRSINGRAAIETHSIVISDTAQSATFRQNPLLPETRGEMAVPLIVANKVVGVLDMQSREPGTLNEEVLPAFEALAGQLAVAIQNSNLLAEAQEARAEVEKQARRLVRTGWNEHLDAIHKPENIGFVFDQGKVTPLGEQDEAQSPVDEMAVSAPIAVTGEPVGSLVVEIDETHKEQTVDLVNMVARQVAQHIENLRLLESAERYRQEAEQASRRLTHEGWQEYLNTNAAESSGFIYDQNEVRPYQPDEAEQIEEPALSLPLKIHDEAIGKLIVKDIEDENAAGLLNIVAERLSQHIEGLRLSMQTEQALASTRKQAQREQALRQITSAVRSSTDPSIILRSAARELGSLLGRQTVVHMATETKTGQADQVAGVPGNAPTDNGNDTASSEDRS